MRLTHGFPPVYDSRSRVLVLGSFPSAASRELGFYYGHPRNRFWPMLSTLAGSAPPKSTPEKRRLLLDSGIALWDTVHSCDITGSSDASIRNAEPNDIAAILSESPIELILCNGQTAAGLYKRYIQPATDMEALTMPSTSPANAAWSLQRLTECWKAALEPLCLFDHAAHRT